MSEISELFKRCAELHRAGQTGVAAQGYAAILQADPMHADAWHLSGILAHQSGRTSDAIDYISHAIEINPQNAEYHSNLSAILLAAGQWQDALASAERAISIGDHKAAAYFQKGRALARLGQPTEAAAALRESLQCGFDRARCLLELSDVLQAVGDLTGSTVALEESLRLNPAQPAAWFSLSRLVGSRHYQLSQEQLRKMSELLRDCIHRKNDKEAARMAFAMAVHADQQKESDQAFQLWKTGNDASRRQLTQAGYSYDPALRTRMIDDLIEFFSADRLKSLAPVSDSARPIVVIGMPRSGTSLIEQILASHDEVAAGGELPFWTNTFRQQFGNSDLNRTLPMLDLQWRRETASQYDAMLEQISSGTQRVVDKMPGNYLFAGLIATAFPEATIIHCRRDPRDTCLSCFAQLFDDEQLQLATSDLVSLADRYRDYWRLMQHWQTVLPGRIVNVPYEHLVHDPEPQVRRLLETCGLPWSDACLHFYRNRHTVQTASVTQVRQPLYRTSQGRWSGYSRHLQPLMQRLTDCIADYETSLREQHEELHDA